MNSKKIVSLSNVLGLVSIIVLVYWIFIFIITQAFDLRILQQTATQTFSWSILGILALMFGALIINIMFNLTRIAQKHNADIEQSHKMRKWRIVIILLSFPVIGSLLFLGDNINSKAREKMLVNSAVSIVDTNTIKINSFANYEFSKEYINETFETLNLLSSIDKNYPSISLIIPENIDGVSVFLIIGRRRFDDSSSVKILSKSDYVFKTDLSQRNYLNDVFNNQTTEKSFTSKKGFYELFFPVVNDDKTIMLYFQDRQSYGTLSK